MTRILEKMLQHGVNGGGSVADHEGIDDLPVFWVKCRSRADAGCT